MNTQNKIVRGRVADRSGHTDFEGTADEAAALVLDQNKNFSKWAFVKNEAGEMEPFFFKTHSQQEVAQFKARLLAVDEPEFYVTGALTGGQD